MIRVQLPAQLQSLAGITGEVTVSLLGQPTIQAVLEAIEKNYPMLTGTLRAPGTHLRRPLIRFFVCNQDWSHVPMTNQLPEAIVSGKEPFLIIGAIAGG